MSNDNESKENSNGRSTISIIKKDVYSYPSKENIFRPNIDYPEYPFSPFISNEHNPVYDMVRDSFRFLHLDESNIGTPKWNPLGEFITPGETVLIKPNLVMEANHIPENGTDCLYTQPSVVAAVIDFVVIATKGKGKIIVGDAPMQECKWDALIEESGYAKLIQWYIEQGINIELVDFRELTSIVKKGVHVQQVNPKAKGHIVDLGKDSEFAGYTDTVFEKMRVTNYDPRILPQHHNERVNEYYISDYVLNADVIINMPKPKTHRKGGVTISLKNFVGINVRKEFLPHHTMGSKKEGGDEYLKVSKLHKFRSKIYDIRNIHSANNSIFIARFCSILAWVCARLLSVNRNLYQEGSWYGNETICKTIVDLNKIVLYADKKGNLCTNPQRKIIVIADMIVCGEKEGPVAPSAKPVGCIATGTDLVCFDEMISTLMGFDIESIPTLRCARENRTSYDIGLRKYPIISSNDSFLNNKRIQDITQTDSFKFKPTSGWMGHIEMG